MRNWAEGALAIIVILALGTALFLFTGESLGGDDGNGTTVISVDSEAAARGETLASGTGCLACHTIDGTLGSGPTWKGIAGASRPLQSGESVIADEAYLTESIIDPAAKVVAGFDAIMPPDYGESLSDADVADLVEYIQSLGS